MQANERVALVVGNASYQHAAPLANPKNDAEDMAALLRRLGFQVTAGLDLTDAAMEDRVRTFSRQARAAKVALFFYAGHGLQVDGVNYLVPVDAQLADEADLPFEALPLDLVLKRMGGGTNLVFLDACRDNPFARSWAGAGRSTAVGRGLTRVGEASGSGLFIAFATDPDRIAADGEGRNSPFTAALKRHMETPGLEINGLLTEVRRTVLSSTGNVQRPWSNSSLSDAFYFVPGTSSSASNVDASRLGVDVPDPATEMWLQIRGTSNVGLLERYLATYPNSSYRMSAEARLETLRGQPFTVVVEPPGARVRILNIKPPYHAGMKLPSGEYRVEASAEGYERKVEMVVHGGSPTTHRMALDRQGRSFRDCDVCPEMVVVPSGTFRMGAPESEDGSHRGERPVHKVSVRSFAAGVYEVTFAEWDACVSAGGCGGHRPGDRNWGRSRRPVIDVSWDDAQLYVRWLSGRTGHHYRLLSESEWEYAARAGTTTPFHTGSTISTDQANYDGSYTYGGGVRGEFRKGTVPVGWFSPNGFGLREMHGNVLEWVQDCWNGNYRGAPGDSRAWESGDCPTRVLRGGSWFNSPSVLRSAYRVGFTAGARSDTAGFRVARTVTP